jgi:hypothetical protein
MELPMLFYWMIWIKLGWDDAHTFSVLEIDLWIFLGISILLNQGFRINLINFILISIFLMLLVFKNMIGSADRDVLMIMLITQSLYDWLAIIFIASSLGLVHAIFKQKKVVPFLFFICLGHFLNFCLKTL